MLKNVLDKFRKSPPREYDESSLMTTYHRLPKCFVRGDGSQLWDEDNKQYIDAMSGNAVTVLGHNHAKLNKAISLQAHKLLQVSNSFHIKEQALLAEKFCQIAQMDTVFFANSSNAATNVAIKIAALRALDKNIKFPVIITAKGGSYPHTKAVSSNTVGSTVTELRAVNYNNIDAIGKHADNKNVVAVMLDAVQGDHGNSYADADYLSSVRALCDEHGWWLIVDEALSGMGRTGKWFAYQHGDCLPDIMLGGNALGNGIAIGACAARGAAAKMLHPDHTGDVFDGNPFACHLALATIDTIERDQLLDAATETGHYLKKLIQQQIGTHGGIQQIRCCGMMLAIELEQRVPDLAMRLLNEGLVAKVTEDGKTINLLPAINLSKNHAQKIAQILHDVIIEL